MPTAITSRERITRQRQAAALLAKFLQRGAKEDLPAIAWTVASAGCGLVGQVQNFPAGERRDDFARWDLALRTWSGHPADVSREHASNGTLRLTEHWKGIDRVAVTLCADIWTEESE